MDMGGMIIECGNVGKLLPAGITEKIPVLHLDFLECFQTIGGKTGAYNADIFDTLLAPLCQGMIGIRF